MTIIDLLNRIANGEETFFETKLNDKSVVVEYYNDRNFSTSTDPELLTISDIIKSLNDEVEILEEEKKIPEKLGYFDLTKDKNEKDENGNNLELHYTGVADTFDDVYEKINEIIDYLDYLKSKGDE